MCATALGTTLTSRRWSMKEDGLKESDGEKVLNSIEMAIWCLMESG